MKPMHMFSPLRKQPGYPSTSVDLTIADVTYDLMLPAEVSDNITRWAALGGFGFGALVFGAGSAAFWCALCTAMAVILNPIYPLPLGELLHGAKILGGCIAAATVIRNW